MLNETNCDWLFNMSFKHPHGRALANECSHIFQTFSHQSEGLATQDYDNADFSAAITTVFSVTWSFWDLVCGFFAQETYIIIIM